MEYVQMTLEEWAGIKQKLEREIREARQKVVETRKSFIRIGYLLRQIKDRKLYEQDGYKSITEFAGKEYGLGPSDTSHLMKLNQEYSVDGYSETLRPEYARLGKGQLVEMMGLPEKDRAMVQPETYREDIRELKRFNRESPEPGVADGLHQLICRFYQDNPDVLQAVYEGMPFGEQEDRRFTETVNPGGNRSYRKGIYFLMMYENRVAVKKFGEDPQDLTWRQFYALTVEAVGETQPESGELKKKSERQDHNEPQQRNTQEGQTTKKAEQKEQDVTEEGEGVQEPGVTEEKKSVQEQDGPKETVAPAQKSRELQKETIPEAETEWTDTPLETTGPETEGTPFETRKEYMDKLTAWEMAQYMAEEYKRCRLTVPVLSQPEGLMVWLTEEVDREGREIFDEEAKE